MSGSFVCPRTGEACSKELLCTAANEGLVGIVPAIAERTSARRALVRAVLLRELSGQGDAICADIRPTPDNSDGSIRICPRLVIDGPFGEQFGSTMAVTAVQGIVNNAINAATSDVRSIVARETEGA